MFISTSKYSKQFQKVDQFLLLQTKFSELLQLIPHITALNSSFVKTSLSFFKEDNLGDLTLVE